MHDLVVTGGLVVDGSGAPAYQADIAVDDGVITEITADTAPTGRRRIDADGKVVTPGFLDAHTHFDGQATWDDVLRPSVDHGVTTVILGNCGVGFAPVHDDYHDGLVRLLEGVEDIPGTALSEGVQWEWSTFTEYLDALANRSWTMDVGTQIPHAPLRCFVMGDRGADPAAVPTNDEIDRMSRDVGAALLAGAFGFSTSRTEIHRSSDGRLIGTLSSSIDELRGIAAALTRTGRGVIQYVSDIYRTHDPEILERETEVLRSLARLGRPLSLTVQQVNDYPDRYRMMLDEIASLRAEGLDVHAQVAPRPIGVIVGARGTACPFNFSSTYRTLTERSVDDQLDAMRDPGVRRRILAEHGARTYDGFRGQVQTAFDSMYIIDAEFRYGIGNSATVADHAAARGVEPPEFVYDTFVSSRLEQLIYLPLMNFSRRDFGAIGEMLRADGALIGLSDAGAHCNTICDASFPTSLIAYWAARAPEAIRIPTEQAVHMLSGRIADYLGLEDRGILRVGALADLNVIDLDALELEAPQLVHDLPAGGTRYIQKATGYDYTLKRGETVVEHGEVTDARPGRLLRAKR